MSAAVLIEVSLVLGVWQRDARHLVLIQLHAVQTACWSNWILWRISSALHTVSRHCGCCFCVFAFHRFPSLSIFCHFFQVSLFFISFPFVSSVSPGLRKSFISSSHLFFGLAAGLLVWCLVLRPGFHFAAFFAHRSSGNDAILTANRHFILLRVSIQQGILAAFILSTAADAILFMYSIQPSSSISPASISSSVSFVREMPLSWSQSVFELLPSAVSSSELLWFAFSSSSSSSFLLG